MFQGGRTGSPSLVLEDHRSVQDAQKARDSERTVRDLSAYRAVERPSQVRGASNVEVHCAQVVGGSTSRGTFQMRHDNSAARRGAGMKIYIELGV